MPSIHAAPRVPGVREYRGVRELPRHLPEVVPQPHDATDRRRSLGPIRRAPTPSEAFRFRSIHGETLALVGESGSGKSVTALSVLQLAALSPGLPSPWFHQGGRQGNARRTQGRPAGAAWRKGEHDLSGAHDLAQPAAHHRAPGGRNSDSAQGAVAGPTPEPAPWNCWIWSACRKRRAVFLPIPTSSPAASASG